MLGQKKLLREIYDASPVKKTTNRKNKKKVNKDDAGVGVSSSSTTHDEEEAKTTEQDTFDIASILAAAAAAEDDDGEKIEQKEEKNNCHLEGYTKADTTGEMSEPRARATRHKGQLNFGNELKHMLHAYGDPHPPAEFPQEPLPETVRALDDIVTDFIIDSCHSAAAVATHAGRQKVKADDFHFMLRDDPMKLGRVQELIRMEKELKEARKVFDQNDDRVGGLKETGKNVLGDEEEEAGEGKEGGKKGKGKKAKTAATSDGGEGSSGSKRKRKE